MRTGTRATPKTVLRALVLAMVTAILSGFEPNVFTARLPGRRGSFEVT
jgi:hypothetical protein